MVIGIGRATDNRLTCLYVGYDSAAAQRAVVGYVFKEIFPPAITTRGAS